MSLMLPRPAEAPAKVGYRSHLTDDIHVCIRVHIYIERERDRERERDTRQEFIHHHQ